MYIATVKVPKQWISLESLIQEQVEGQSSFAFDSNTTYQLQGESDAGIRLLEASIAPDNRKEGFRILGTQVALYKKSTGSLFVSSVAGVQEGGALLKISALEA